MVEENTFNSLKYLKTLDLRKKSIISIPDIIFLGLTDLRAVYLNGNPVYQIYQNLCSPNQYCKVY